MNPGFKNVPGIVIEECFSIYDDLKYNICHHNFFPLLLTYFQPFECCEKVELSIYDLKLFFFSHWKVFACFDIF